MFLVFFYSQAIREVRVFLVIIHLWTDSKTARRTYQTENTEMFCNFVIFCNFVLFKMGVFCIFNYSYLSNKPTLGKRGPNSSQKITFFLQLTYKLRECTLKINAKRIIQLLMPFQYFFYHRHMLDCQKDAFFSFDFFHSNTYLVRKVPCTASRR